MVLLASAVVNKSGQAILSRQFVEMSRSRIEGLLSAFPKVITPGKQHTFVETDSVRYVYQPLDKLFMVLITTKASNILEDLETLRLFARIIPEYCKDFTESEIANQAFPLIFAFDEVVALGYRESVNLSQIRTFTEMDSHEEKVFKAVRETQEREAKENMKRKAKELQQMRRGNGGIGSTGIGSNSISSRSFTPHEPITTSEPSEPAYQAPQRTTGGRGMKLGKTKDVESFVDQLKSEGEKVTNKIKKNTGAIGPTKNTPVVNQDSVHLRIEEKINLTANRDGGIESMELQGFLMLVINEENSGNICINVTNNDKKSITLQTHPNVDKKLFVNNGTICLKNSAKSFPIKQDIGVLKWRFQTQEESHMPLTINCWPNETANGCDVNIEYELQCDKMELTTVEISIPIQRGVSSPVISECDGDYTYDARSSMLHWSIPIINTDNKSGAIEFSVAGNPDDFFPINVNFTSKLPYCDIQINGVQDINTKENVKYSSEVGFLVTKYAIV